LKFIVGIRTIFGSDVGHLQDKVKGSWLRFHVFESL
jgi:hypothetical protein